MSSEQTRQVGHGSFAAQLRTLRLAAGLSQEELASRAHLTTHAVSALERGTRTRPFPSTVRALADALDVSADERSALFAAVPSRRAEGGGGVGAAQVADRRLPVPPTPLLARAAELDQVTALIRDPAQRLLTLTGLGGVGKTRLAISAASAVVNDFSDGVTFVGLAQLLDPELVLPHIAEVTGAGKVAGADAQQVAADHLRDRTTLLVLDNFEHLLGAVPSVAALLQSCPGLTLLVTSRSALRVRGETEVRVAPLALPDPVRPSMAEVADSPAGELFLDRARSVSPQPPADDDAVVIARICAHLAGIPLALELAAARLRFLDPATLLARLDEAIEPDGARDLPARQRTMNATLDWSYGLAKPPERCLLRLLSVFSGGFALADVEAVCAAAGTVPSAAVLEALESLVEQSLVARTEDRGGRLRHAMLEPVAQYARGKLVAEGEAGVVGAAHTMHFVALAEQAAPQYERATQVEWLARIDAEHANMSAAIRRAIDEGPVDAAGRLGWALWLYWWLRGLWLHGRTLLEEALRQPLSDPVRTRAMVGSAALAFAQGNVEDSRDHYAAALARSRESGDLLSQANGLAGLGLNALATGDLPGAKDLFTASLPVATEAGSEAEWVQALTHIWLGTIALLEQDPDGAVASIERGLESARRRGDRLSIYIALYNLSQVAEARGDHAGARTALEESVRLSVETGDAANLAYCLDELAVVESRVGAHDRVPVLIGAAQGLREGLESGSYGYYQPDTAALQLAVTEAGARLSPDAYDDALDTGRSLGLAEAAAFALSGRS